MTTVGFVGLGLMGSRMAARLIQPATTLHVYNRTEAKAAALLEAGAIFSSPAPMAATCDIVFTCLSTPAVVQDTYATLLASARPGTLFIDHSTIDPETAQALGRQAIAAGCRFLDAPVSGGPWGAEAGTLTIMVGGEAEAYEEASPWLRHLGQKLYHCGPQGSGSVVKLCNNLLVGIHAAAAAEAMVLGVQAGIEPQLLHDVIKGATGQSAQLERNMERFAFVENFEPGFSIDMLHKDLVLASGLARNKQLRLLLGSLTEQIFQEAQGWGLGPRDTSAVILPLEEQAGVKVRISR